MRKKKKKRKIVRKKGGGVKRRRTEREISYVYFILFYFLCRIRKIYFLAGVFAKWGFHVFFFIFVCLFFFVLFFFSLHD